MNTHGLEKVTARLNVVLKAIKRDFMQIGRFLTRQRQKEKRIGSGCGSFSEESTVESSSEGQAYDKTDSNESGRKTPVSLSKSFGARSALLRWCIKMSMGIIRHRRQTKPSVCAVQQNILQRAGLKTSTLQSSGAAISMHTMQALLFSSFI